MSIHTSQIKSVSKNKKINVKENFDQIKANAISTVQKYTNSLAKLQSIKLHKDLSKTPNQTLADVYHDFSKMEKWRKNCENLEILIEKKISGIFENLKKVKEEIVFKNNQVKTFVKNFDEFENESETHFRKSQIEIEKFLEEFFSTFLDLRRKISSSLENTKESFLLLNSSEFYKVKMAYFKDFCLPKIKDLVSMAGKTTFATFEVYSKNMGQISENKKLVNNFFETLEKINTELEILKKQDCEKLERDYSFLLKPILFPAAYLSFLLEISRRKKSYSILKQIIDVVTEFVSNDNSFRREFLAKYGNVLPDSFTSLASSLKDLLNCKIIINFEEFDRLPNLEDLDQYLIDNQTGENQSQFSSQKKQINTLDQIKNEEVLPVLNKLIILTGLNNKQGQLDQENAANDEKKIMHEINLNNLKEELEAYKGILRSCEIAVYPLDFETFKKTLLSNEKDFKKSISDLLIQNSRVVVDALENLYAKKTMTDNFGNGNLKIEELKIKLKEFKEENEVLVQENQTNVQAIEGMKNDLRKMELFMETNLIDFRKKKDNLLNSVRLNFDNLSFKIKRNVLEMEKEINLMLENVKKELTFKIKENFQKKKKLFSEKLNQVENEFHQKSEIFNKKIEMQLSESLKTKKESENYSKKMESMTDIKIISNQDTKNKNQQINVLCLPYENGQYVVFLFEKSFLDFENKKQTNNTQKISSFVNFSNLSTTKKLFIEENNFLILGRTNLQAIYQNEKEKDFINDEIVVDEVLAILSFDVSKKIWFNLN